MIAPNGALVRMIVNKPYVIEQIKMDHTKVTETKNSKHQPRRGDIFVRD